MEKFEVTILGCGSALPTMRHYPSAQVLNVRDKLFLIDCGEGTQLQYRKASLSFARLYRIFISHLHGDHCYGLPGLISSLELLGRTAELHIHSPQGLEEMVTPMLGQISGGMPYERSYKVYFHPFEVDRPTAIYEDRTLTVTTIPLQHRVPCCGFLFSEKPLAPHILREAIDRYNIPYSEIGRIKAGADYVTPGGEVIVNALLTSPADPPRRYAYVSDTAYRPQLAEQLRSVDLLYHESTYAQSEQIMAEKYQHSTALQAAQLARAAGVGELLLGHFSDRYHDENILLEEARTVFPRTALAKELTTFAVKPKEANRDRS